MKFFRYILVFSLLINASNISAQVTKVRGRVTDASTGEPLPYTNVIFTGTTIGTTTDMDGNFTLETREKVNELTVTFLSYEKQTRPVIYGAFNQIDCKLVPIVNELEIVVVRPGENLANQILKLVAENKRRNNPDRMSSYSYSTYTKMELDLANMKSSFKNKRMQKNFGFVFNYMDTSAITGKVYLPIMISESSSDYYYRKNPRVSREIVKASRISGIREDYTFAQFTGNLHVNINFYENYINIFDVNFISPLSNHGTLFYKYYLVDSLQAGGRKIYKIRFHPKNKTYPVFDGEVNIDSLTWALESASMRMIKGLNVNWIKDLALETKQQLVNDSTWFVKQDKIMADFSMRLKDSSKWVSFMAQRQVDYMDVRIDAQIPPDIAKLHNDVVVDKDVLNNDEEFWQLARPYELSEREQNIYIMVDSIRKVPLFKNISDVINSVLFGYMRAGKIEFGPYYKLYSFNKFEGNRFQLGIRTNPDFSKKLRLTGYAAYGTKDTEIKGGGTIECMFNNHPTSKLTFSGKHDVLQLGVSENAFTTGNIMGSIFSRGNDDKMTLINQFNAKWEKEWVEGVTNKFGMDYRQMFANSRIDFVRPDGTEMDKINSLELKLGIRFSKNEIVVRDYFEKISIGSDYPIVHIALAGGLKNILNSDYEYFRAELSVQHDIPINPIGKTRLILSGGEIFGKVPYPLLKLHEGNATYFYDPYAFSCMNFYEFASDLWGSVMWEHHFSGFFLGKMPFMKHLKLREVTTVKVLWGRLDDKNNGSLQPTNAILLFPEGMTSVSKPYIEAGVGVENIFRLFRVDVIWRLTQRENRDTRDNLAINFSFGISF